LLEFLGLDDSAAAVYRALLSADARLAEISVTTGFSESAVRAALGTLAKLGLAAAPVSASDGWRPVRPELAFAALAQEFEAELASRTHQLAALGAAVAAATAIWSARLQHTGRLIELLDGAKEALAEADRLAAQATKEYLQVMPTGQALLAPLHSGISILESAVARGVSVRVLCHDTTRSGTAALAYARRAAGAGAEVRTAPTPPLALVICDGQVALIPAAPERPQAALRIGEPALVAVLCAVFENNWDTATPLGVPISADGRTGLAPGEQALLRLMAAGLTDEAAAKRLGVSLRTVRRQIQALMTRLQATSRFQAGHNAAQRGWLSGTSDPGSSGRFHKHLHSIPEPAHERPDADYGMGQ
jgi:DNA-binding CsgD family transcriptional regulator/sugar-specific transcriptional regulator TrmB